jgi:hypothetical protein
LVGAEKANEEHPKGARGDRRETEPPNSLASEYDTES